MNYYKSNMKFIKLFERELRKRYNLLHSDANGCQVIARGYRNIFQLIVSYGSSPIFHIKAVKICLNSLNIAYEEDSRNFYLCLNLRDNVQIGLESVNGRLFQTIVYSNDKEFIEKYIGEYFSRPTLRAQKYKDDSDISNKIDEFESDVHNVLDKSFSGVLKSDFYKEINNRNNIPILIFNKRDGSIKYGCNLDHMMSIKKGLRTAISHSSLDMVEAAREALMYVPIGSIDFGLVKDSVSGMQALLKTGNDLY